MEKTVKEMTFSDAEKLVLKVGEIVKVKPIIRKRPFFKAGHDGEFMFTGTFHTYQLPFKMSTRSYVNLFEGYNKAKASELQEAFEILFDKPKGSLNFYNRKSEFWTKYKVEIGKEGKELDLSIPSHVMDYLLLKCNTKRITDGWSNRHKAGLEFALVNDSQVREEDNKRAATYENAMDLFISIRKNNSKLYNTLRLLDKKPLKENRDNTEWLKTELLKIIEVRDKKANKQVKTVYDFVNVVNDKSFETKVLIYDAMDAKEITMRNGFFKLATTDAIMGKSLAQASDWIDSIEQHEEKIILQQRLKG